MDLAARLARPARRIPHTARPPRRLLFVGRPSAGHLYPLVPLALAARAAGHEVRFGTGAEFRLRLEWLGFRTHRVGTSIEAARRQVLAGRPEPPRSPDGQPDWDVVGRMFGDVLPRATVADLLGVVDAWRPDLVVFESTDFGAPIAADLTGVRSTCLAIGRAMPATLLHAVGSRPLDRIRASYGTVGPPVDELVSRSFLDPYPEVLQDPAALAEPGRTPLRPVPWNEPFGLLPRWVRHRTRPLVYVTLGSVARDPRALLTAVAGLADLPVDVLVALGPLDRGAFADLHLPRRVRITDYVDQALLLPNVDLVVHHGGTGTTTGALVHGMPQLLLPQGADQFVNADAVTQAGVGRALRGREVTPDDVRAQTAQLLRDGDVLAAARAARDAIATLPAPADVLPRLLDAARVPVLAGRPA